MDDMVELEDVVELMDVSTFDVAAGTGDLLARACFSATRCLQAVASTCRDERAATGDDHNAVGGRAYGSWGLACILARVCLKPRAEARRRVCVKKIGALPVGCG